MSAFTCLVTGGNSGIGFALCQRLATERNAHVFLCSRNKERGQKAVEAIVSGVSPAPKVDLLVLDVANEASVHAAAEVVRQRGVLLDALVNNAGTGLAHNVSSDEVVDTNLYGPKRMCEAFLPLLKPDGGRIVNVGSGAGPMWMAKQTPEVQQMLMDREVTWEKIAKLHASERPNFEGFGAYGFSKASLAAYTMLLARENPQLVCSSLSPGFIDTAIVAGFGAKKTPYEGTVSLMHCLFDALPGSGFYYGSDALRSPLNKLRNPGEPEYTE